MDFFQRLGNFFGGKGWVNDEEKRRKEQQAQSQPIQQPQPQQIQQPQLNGQSTLQVRPNVPWGNQNSGLNQSQPKVNFNPLEQANQANQQLNQNNQPKPQVTTNDAPKMLTPEGQQDWVNKQNQQIQIQNAVKQPIQQQPQPIQQPKPQPVQPQIQQPKPELQTTVASPYRSSVLNSQGDSIARALDAVNKNIAQYKTEQATRNDAIDNKLRARGVSEPEILSKRQERIRLENEAHVAANEARQSQNMANMLKPVAAIAQPIDSARRAVVKGMDNVNKWIDSYDDKAGFQVDNPGDYVRFAGKLVPGMIQGAAEGPEKLASAVVGKRMTEDGRVENLNGMQRLGSAADGAIDLFGVPFGASGQLVKSALKQGGKEVAKEAVDQAVRKRVLGAVKNITSGAVKEGAEETVQSLAGDLADDGKINTDWKQHAQAGALGALGGAMMGTGGKAISTLRNRATNTQTSQSANVPNATATTIAQPVRPNQQQAPGKLEQEALAQRQVQQVQNQNTGYTSLYRRPADNRSLRQAAEVNAVNTRTNQTHPIQQVNVNQTVETTIPNASPALKQAVSQNMSDIQRGDVKAVASRQQTTGKLESYLVEQATQNVQNTVAQDVRYKMDNQSNTQLSTDPVMNVRNADGETMADMTVRLQNEGVSSQGIQMAQERFRSQAENYIANPQSMPAWSMPDAAENADTNYMMAHRPDENGPRAFNMEEDGMLNGFYDSPSSFGVRASEASHQESMDALNAIRNNPNADVTIYRAAPSSELNDGDWVTLSQTYAKQHQESNLNGSGEIHAFTVKAKDLRFAGDDINEFGYFPNRGDVDVKMQLVNETMNEAATTTMEVLKARHLDLTGDENLVFNEWQNEMQRKALGYYDPNTDKINLNKLSEDTLNHELGHKLLERADNKQELLDTIRESYGDDYLISKYGKEYGDSDINLLAEEQLADGFSDYYNGILNSEDKVRLGARLGIPQKVLAVYDRITEAIRGLIGKQDIIKQFYAQMETGKFRNAKQQVPGGDGRVRTMSIDPNKALETIKKFDDVLRGIRRITKLDVISHESATKIQQATGIDVRGGASIELTNKNAIHIHNRHIVNPDDSLPLSDYDIAALPEIIKDPDTITKEKVVRGVQRIKFEREMKGNKKAIVEVIKKGNALNVVTYFNDSSSGRPNTDNTVSGYTSETGQLQSTNLNDSVANNTQNVNTNNRYQHPLQETIDNIQDNPKPKMTKELRQAIDSRIAETNPELFADQETNIMGGGTNWNIPRIHVDDLKHYLGSLTEDIPVAYRRRTGKRDIDTIAQEMGYDEIDSFVQELQRAAESRRRVRENKEMLAELRKDPETIALAQQDVEQATQERVRVAKETKENAWNELKDIIEYRKAAMMDGNAQDVADANREITRIARQAGLKQQELRQFISKYGANMIPDTNTAAQPAESGSFTNVPMEDGHLLTKGNLYEQTKSGLLDNWTNPFRDGDYEYRVHTKRSRDGKKSFTNFERRYIYEDGKPGDWVPTSRAAYIWKSQTNSINKVGRNEAILKALEAAKQDGEVQEFMAYKNPDSAGGVAVVPLVGEHSIDGGFVRNPRSGEIEGNYIQVTPFGVVHQVNGKFDVVEADHLTNSLDKSKGGITDTFNRLVEKNIQDKVGQKLLKDLYYQKTEAYANYADEIENLLGKHAALAKHIDKARPRFAKSKKFWEDVGLYTEGKFPVGSADENMNAAFAKKYGSRAAERVKEYNTFMRNNYDALISNLNSIRRMYGKEEIPYLKNYMPHIQKRSNILGRAVDKLLAAVPTGVRGDMEGQARGEIPASIAGLSADFKPTHKFNANEKRRFGGMMSYEKDPRKAFEYYADVMLYNTHMEPVIARGRQIESSMRAIDMAKKSGTNIDPDSNLAKGDKISSKATIAVQNFVNEMAGKSSSLDRPFIDQTNRGVQFIQRLESINGANKILGNLSSTLAQTLNLPETVRDNGLRSTGHAFLTAFDKSTKEAMRKSPFLRERYTDTDGKFTKSQYQKFTNGISVVSGMNLVEKKFIQLNWAANYYSAQRKGLTGYQLIKAADQATERAVGGRGVGAMPQVYKSTLGKMFLQFTYETNESWKNNVANVKRFGSEIRGLQFKDAGGTATRAAEAFAVAYGMNMLMKLATGSEPLANMYDAIKDVLSNDADDDGEDDKLGQKMARVGSELAKLNPIASASLNMAPKSEREKIFGKTSDLGRFDGATGVAQTVANLIGAGYYSTQGDNEKAQKNLQGLIPVGNQIKKTTSGIKVLQDGGDVYTDKNGKEHTNFEVDSGSAWNQAKALLFGKNALRPDEKSAATSTTGDDTGKTIKDFERGLKKGTYKIQDGLLVNKSGNVQRNYYKSLAEGQGVSDEAYYNWMKAYNIDNASTTKKEFNSSNDILNKLENGEKKVNKAKSAVDILMGKHKDLPDWVRERYYQESGYTKEQIEYGAMTTHKEVSLMDNYWRQKAQESSHEELMQALTNGRRKSIIGQMFAKNGVINKLRAEGYITKWEARALNAAQFDIDGNRITKEGSGSSSRGGSGRGRGGRSGRSANSGVASIGIKAAANISSAAPKASQTSVGGMSINQIGQNLISRMNTQKQVNAAIKKWNAKTSGKNTRIRTKKA